MVSHRVAGLWQNSGVAVPSGHTRVPEAQQALCVPLAFVRVWGAAAASATTCLRVTGQAETPACCSIPVSCPGVSEPGVKLARRESELFHLNFWSSQGGFP